MRELFIHVGAGKTGTTAIQEFLKLNEDKIEGQGISIPKSGRNKSKRFIYHHNLAGGVNRIIDEQDVLELWKNLSNMEGGKLLVTSELFHSLIVKGATRKLFYDIKRILNDFHIKVIFYIRRDDQWLQSAYEQWVKSGSKRDGETISEFIKRPMMHLGDQILEFANIFGKNNVIVRPFEKSQFVKGNIFDDFAHILGLRLDDSFSYPAKNPNPRLSVDALEFKRIFNTVCKDREESQSIISYLELYSHITDANSTSVFRKAGLLSEEERRFINKKNDPVYRMIAQEFLGRKDGVLFYDEYDVDAVDHNFDLESLTRIVSFIFLEMEKKLGKN